MKKLRPKGKTTISWLCQCDCGGESWVIASQLVYGRTGSCGCVKRSVLANAARTHGQSRSATYNSWRAMKSRCQNENDKVYSYYGGRGIQVCDRWNIFANFLADMGECPPGLTIERKDVDADYEPLNCKWATRARQSLNKRNNRILTVRGRSMTIGAWAEETGLSRCTIRERLQKGWSHEDAVLQPPRSRKPQRSRTEDPPASAST